MLWICTLTHQHKWVALAGDLRLAPSLGDGGREPTPANGTCRDLTRWILAAEPRLKAVATIDRHDEARQMDTARLFQSGRSQAVRLPKAYRFSGTEVIVKHFGNGVLLLPIEDPWQTLEAGLAAFEPGFQLSREQPEQQQRPEITP